MDNKTITLEQLETLTFAKGTVLTGVLSTSFDTEARKNEESANVKLKIDVSGENVADLIQNETVKNLTIKINNRLKASANDSEGYLKYLELNKHTFKFSYSELTERKTADPMAVAAKAVSKMTPEQLAHLMEQVAKMQEG